MTMSLCTQYIHKETVFHFDVEELDWSAQSTNLNPIQLKWTELNCEPDPTPVADVRVEAVIAAQ